MAVRVVDVEIEQRKRELRARIAANRIEFVRRATALEAEKRRLASWRTYVAQFPLASLGMAFGVGLFASAGLSPRRAAGWIGKRLLLAGLGGLQMGAAKELADMWRAILGGATTR